MQSGVPSCQVGIALNLFIFKNLLVVFLLRIHAWSGTRCCASCHSAADVDWKIDVLEQFIELFTFLLALCPQLSNCRFFHSDPVSLGAIFVFFEMFVESPE
jgi:hypothetical protein